MNYYLRDMICLLTSTEWDKYEMPVALKKLCSEFMSMLLRRA